MHTFPFSAVVGQEKLKLALLLAACDPSIGGVLISGTRGSAKSTLARGLANVLPYKLTPFVNLPLGITEDRLLGSLNIEKVLADGRVEFRAGLFAQANEGILYVDEINLLADHLVDLLLDVSASGMNYVEREGISHQHVARFILIGTMNPDEGELRPQLLDRFGLCVDITTQTKISTRVEIVQRKLRFEQQPDTFITEFQPQQDLIKEKIQTAQACLSHIIVSTKRQQQIAKICVAAHVEGVRADLALYRAARAHAALKNKFRVNQDDLNAVVDFVLAHRKNETTITPPPSQTSENQPNDNENTQNKQSDWGSSEPEKVEIGLKRQLNPYQTKKKLL